MSVLNSHGCSAETQFIVINFIGSVVFQGNRWLGPIVVVHHAPIAKRPTQLPIGFGRPMGNRWLGAIVVLPSGPPQLQRSKCSRRMGNLVLVAIVVLPSCHPQLPESKLCPRTTHNLPLVAIVALPIALPELPHRKCCGPLGILLFAAIVAL